MLPPADLLDRIIASDIAYTRARMGVIAARPGNPFGVAMRRDGDAHGFSMPGIPSPSFNRAVGLGEAHAELVGAYADWFAQAGVAARFEVMPDRHGPGLARALAAAGYAQTGFDVVTWAVPRAAAAALPLEVVDATLMDGFLDVHLEAWSLPAAHREGAKTNMRGWLGLPGWTLLMARADGEAAGTAVLHVADGVAYVADTATRPARRRQGAQTALLRRCLQLAFEAGAEIVWSRAAFLSGSHRNMLRTGLRNLCTPAFWTA